MADILMFKNEKVKEDIWNQMEKDLRGTFVLQGISQEINSELCARMRKIYHLIVENPLPMSFRFDHLVRLTPEESEGLSRQIEQQLQERFITAHIGKIFGVIAVELLEMEKELYRLRNEVGGEVS